MRKNNLRELLKTGQPTVGTHMHNSWPTMIELVGRSGMFDYVEFVAEYAPYDLYALENMARAVDLFPHLTGMVKIEQGPRLYLVAKVVGAGMQSLLFADVRTAADVEECVRAVRAETPSSGGLHGAGARRDVDWVEEGGTEAFVQSLEDVVIALMIEKKEAVE
ncbi:MAG: 2,4-dihydroxyhept-2-ene-1,7-dioic acid aldolase, partial [Chloroflexota bacterium]